MAYLKRFINKAVSLSLLLYVPFSFSGITTIEALSFGTIAVLNNDSTSDITISPANNITITNQIRILVPGTRGEFLLTNYPAHIQVSITANIVAAETVSATPPSEQFTLINIDTAPSVTTDGTGIANIYVGGTLRTSGSGSGQYFDSTYTATYELDINF